MTLRVLHHNNCFDGACSAAIFAKFHRECIGTASAYEFVGLAHEPNRGIDESCFITGENAVVDFKYSTSPHLTWWFDHHESAFRTPADLEKFKQGQQGPEADRQFFDPNAISCTGFIARTATARFGFDASALTDLLHWTDIVDGARFPSAASAVEMKEPALKLTLVIENAAPGVIPRIIPLLTEMPLAQVLEQPFIQQQVAPLWEKHLHSMSLVKQQAVLLDGTIYLDLTDQPIEVVSKFIPYYYHPEATYAVVMTRSSSKTKISVGTNPWLQNPLTPLLNIADICARFGGGGHAKVGAISLPKDHLEKAREIATTVVAELRASHI